MLINPDIKKINFTKRLKANLMYLGFDFDLLGSHYLKEIAIELINKPDNLHRLTTTAMLVVANKNGITVKAIDKDIKWAINKAYDNGLLKNITVFSNGKKPTVKQLINWIFDFFIADVALD